MYLSPQRPTYNKATPSFFAHVLKDSYGAFTLDVKSVLNENLGDILDGTQC
jgi:hypothetical protein